MFFQSKRNRLSRRLKNCIIPATTPDIGLPQVAATNTTPYLQNTVTENGGGSVAAQLFRDCFTHNTINPASAAIDPKQNFQSQVFPALIAKLKEKQLETLSLAVEVDCGRQQQHQHHHHQQQNADNNAGLLTVRSDCILVPKENIHDMPAHVIACKLWRWPDLVHATELKRSPACRSKIDPVYICCNPAHWSRRVQEIETPPPAYDDISLERLKQEKVLEDIHKHQQQTYIEDVQRQIIQESFSTIGEGLPSGSTWCRLAYWELSERVGRQFPVDKPIVHIFADQFLCSSEDELSFSLASVAQQRTNVHESVLRTRMKIGLGITISKESDGVWLYNRSSSPVFVHSPTLSDIENKFPTVWKVLPGHCLRAYDPLRAATLDACNNMWPGNVAGAQTGPVDIHSLRISFAKGWGGRDGPTYRRMDVTSCPCWLEVMINR